MGDNFQWQYHQHSAKMLPNGNLLLHDNGNYRATPTDPPLEAADNHTRAVEYAIDEQSMTVSQVWEYGSAADEVLYSPTRGDADWLAETDNVLITYADVRFINGISTGEAQARIIEVDRAGETVFDLTVGLPGADTRVYRSERIPTLYPPEYTVTTLPLDPELLVGDIDGDGIVAFADFVVLSPDFDLEGTSAGQSDLNGDGAVDFADFLLLSKNFGQRVKATVASVPEPTFKLVAIGMFLGLFVRVPSRRATLFLGLADSSWPSRFVA